MLIIDTCSWFKIRHLKEINLLDLLPIMNQSDLWSTHELLVEYHHFLEEFLDFSKFSILSVNLTFVRDYTEEELDDADLSLLEFGRRNPQAVVISDDEDALMICKFFKIRCFQLSEFLLFLVNQDIISKREAYHSIRQLRDWNNIGKQHFKSLKHQLQEIK
jgi:hypothetical protein